MKAQEAQIAEQEKATRKLGEAERGSAKAGQENLAVRKSVTTVVSEQADAIDAVAAALQRETGLLTANTRAWTAAAEARAAALGPTRAGGVVGAPAVTGAYGATTVGYSDALAAFEAQQARAAASGGAARVEATAAASAAATQAAARRVEEPGLYEQLLARQRARQAATEEALAGVRQPALLTSGTTFIGRERGPSIPTTAGRAPTPAYDLGLGQFGPARATEEQLALVAAQKDMQASLAGVDAELARSSGAWRLYSAETAAASQALTRHGALSSEFIQALARGEVTVQEFGTALVSTIGKFAGWAVAGGLVYGAFEALKQVVRGATETATGVAQLERAQIPGFNAAQAEEGFRRTGARVNVPIPEVAEAQFYAARAGFNKTLSETQSAGETALLAFKLDQVPIQEAARGLGAVRTAFGLNAQQIRQVFNELDVGQLKFNARLQQTLPYLGRSSAAFETAGGSIQQLVRQIVEVTGAVPGGGGGGGSGSAATFFTREPGNLRRAAAQDILREYGFNVRQGIGDLNEALQRAAREGRTPSGIPVDESVRFRLAEAISGGPALAGRYGIQLINAGLTGKAEEVTKQLAKAEGASGEDLAHRLSQFNEQASAIGHTFERVGSEIGSSGIVAAGEDFITIIRGMGEATAFVVQPLGQLGSIFSSLPKPLQEAAVALGALAVASRAGGFNLLAPSLDKEYVRAAAKTTSDALARQRSVVERRSAELERGGEREYEIAREKQRFAQAHGRELEVLPYDDPRRQKLQVQGQAIDERLGLQRDANVRTNERLVTAHERLLQLEGDQAIIDNRRIQVSQKAEQLRARGVVGAPGGIGGGLISPTGELVGARAAAQGATFVAGPAGSGAKLTEALDRTTVGVLAGGSQLADGMASTARVQIEGAAGLKEALGIAGRQAAEGGILVADALKQSAVYIATAGRAGALSAGEIAGAGRQGAGLLLGGAAGAAGSLGARVGQNALRGVMYAFIGSAIAEVAGEAVSSITGSKRAGAAIGGIGSDVALGAGAGALFGVPEVGAAVGLGAGLLDQLGIFGGGSQAEATKTARLKAEKRSLEEGASKNAASIEGQAAEFASSLEAAVKDESESAVKAREKVSQIIKKLAEETESLGLDTGPGREAAEGLAKTLADAYIQQFQGSPQERVKAAATYQEALEAASKAGDRQLQVNLRQAGTPRARQEATAQALFPIQQARQNANEAITSLHEQLAAEEKKQQQDLASLPAARQREPITGGLAGARSGITKVGAAGRVEAALEADATAIEALRRRIKEAEGAARQHLEKALSLIELEKIEPGIKETQQEIASEYEKKVAEAGNNPALVRKLEAERRQKQLHAAAPFFTTGPAGGKKFREEENKHAGEAAKEAAAATQEQLKEAEAVGAREIAALPAGTSAAQVAAVRARIAAARLAIIKRNQNNAFNNNELIQAEASLDEANKARAEALQSEATELTSLRGQIRQAADYGNAIAQAGDAQRTASELLGLAKNEKERLTAQLALINAGNQLQQAQQQRIADLGALRESTEIEPSQKARTHLETLRKQFRTATPDERIKIQKEINETTIKAAQEQTSEQDAQIKFELELHQITNATAIRRLQALLKQKDLTRSTRRQYESEIYKLENETSQDFAVGSIRQAPTLYDALTLSAGRRVTSTPRGTESIHFASLRHEPQLTQHNTIHINVTGGKPGQFAHEMERVFGTLTRAQLRSAGLT